MSPIRGGGTVAGGVVSSVNPTGMVNNALSKGGPYTMPGGTKVFSASTINNVVKYSGSDQLLQNPAVKSGVSSTSFGVERGTSQALGQASDAVRGIVNNPVAVSAHIQQLDNYAVNNPGVRPNNELIGYKGPTSPGGIVTVNGPASPQAITRFPAGAELTVQKPVTYPVSQAELQYGLNLQDQ
jgi:hypothetical protein